MIAVDSVVQGVQAGARMHRARVFRGAFKITPATRILHWGPESGSAVAAVLSGTGAQPNNVHLAGSNAARLQEGQQQFGFVPVVLPPAGRLPFDDGFFDIVYCSSIIEQCLPPETDVWALATDHEFRQRVHQAQLEVAREIRRVGRGYYVQARYQWFPLNSHTWLPFFDYLPRPQQMRVLAVSNRYWIKRARPDWCLPRLREMRDLFPDADIRRERFLGLTKSIMAVRP